MNDFEVISRALLETGVVKRRDIYIFDDNRYIDLDGNSWRDDSVGEKRMEVALRFDRNGKYTGYDVVKIPAKK